jgi:hypothetical protein
MYLILVKFLWIAIGLTIAATTHAQVYLGYRDLGASGEGPAPDWQLMRLYPKRPDPGTGFTVVTLAVHEQVIADLASLKQVIKEQLQGAAIGELETKLLDRISALDRRIRELELAQAKAAPSGAPKVPK